MGTTISNAIVVASEPNSMARAKAERSSGGVFKGVGRAGIELFRGIIRHI